jgi:hypothetical protein
MGNINTLQIGSGGEIFSDLTKNFRLVDDEIRMDANYTGGS